MFVRDFIHVDQPFEAVGPRFVSDTSWLTPIAVEAAQVARDLALRLADRTSRNGPAHDARDAHEADAGPDPTGGPIRCEIGPVRARARGILVPMWLVNERGTALLPDLTGDLEVAPVGATTSLIALDATYQRPTREHDELRRVERATEVGVRAFLSGIAEFLGRPVSAR